MLRELPSGELLYRSYRYTYRHKALRILFFIFFNHFEKNKSFCKIIRPFQNLSVLTTNRRALQRPPWPMAV
jgi:hypothetical protein